MEDPYQILGVSREATQHFWCLPSRRRMVVKMGDPAPSGAVRVVCRQRVTFV